MILIANITITKALLSSTFLFHHNNDTNDQYNHGNIQIDDSIDKNLVKKLKKIYNNDENTKPVIIKR